MSEHKIIWTEKTWNVFTGCTKCSPGCHSCYAERMSKRLHKIPSTAEKYRNGFEFTYHPMELFRPYHWKKSSKIFVNSMSDTFHENSDVRPIRNIFKTMNECPQHTFQLLTKRPQNIPDDLYWTKNIHLGVTVCTQEEADKKIPILVNVGAAFSFLSIEPMLERIDLSKYWICRNGDSYPFPYIEEKFKTKMIDMVDMVIVGGESGPGARSMHPDWVRSVRDQCAEANVPFLFKQWGEWAPFDQLTRENKAIACERFGTEIDPDFDIIKNPVRFGRKITGRTLDGVIHDGK